MPAKRIDLTDSVGFELPWTAEDAAALRHFLGTVTGKRFIGQLLLKRPPVSERTDPFKRGIQSGVLEGHEETLRQIATLIDSTKSVTKNT